MKTLSSLLSLSLLLCILNIHGYAQQRRPNPRLSAILAIKDTKVLQDTLNNLRNSQHEQDLQLLANYYNGANDPDNNEKVLALIRERFPNGRMVFDDLRERIYTERDPVQNERNYKLLVAKYGSRPEYNLDASRYYVAITFLGKGNPEKVEEYLNMIQNEEYKTRAFSYAARESIAAKDWQLGEKLIRKTFADLNGDTTHSGFDEFSRIFSELVYHNGKYEEGFPYAKKLYDKQSVTTAVGVKELGMTYLNYLMRLKKYQEAYPEMLQQLEAGQASPLVKESFREAYTAVNGSEQGFEEFATSLTKQFRAQVQESVRQKMVNTPAFDFAVKDLVGKTVRLSDYQGKVVILDFWATWCGPCKALFPKMQLAVDKYKHDKDIVFLFIHTLETGPDPAKAANDYLTDMNYDFNLLMDIKDPATGKNAAAEGYAVRGIPHKVIIDGQGNIRFASTGNNIAGDDAFLENMTAMIELAKTSD